MLKKAVRRIWRVIPGKMRSKIVRVSQDSFTVSTAAVVVNEKGEVLLLNHVLRPYSGWGFPGGFVNKGEQIDDAVRREVREETGIELTDLRLFEINTHRSHIEVLWSARPVGEPKVNSAEIIELDWFALGDIPQGIGRAQQRQIREVLAQTR